MKEVFARTGFPAAPGGNLYHWRAADTLLDIARDGQYIVEITASAKNAAQNQSADDDDLRVVIDGYAFGKQEIHQEKVSWKGFGTAAAWDGASLQGGSKTIYFFVPLSAGEHRIEFWADATPTIQSVRVLQIEQLESGAIEDVVFDFQEKAPGQHADVHGIPWKAFIFAPDFPVVRLADITATAQSGKQKGTTDGDNIKLYVNGRIVHNPKAPTSDKYKNFFFSGDLSQGRKESLMISGKDLLLNDQDVSLELWYDATPLLDRVKIELESTSAYLKRGTLRRQIMDDFEALQLPLQYWGEWANAYFYAIHALDVALQYAQQHHFTFVDDAGIQQGIVDNNEPDALRHFTWNVLLTQAISEEGAQVISTNHERFWMKASNKEELSRAGVMDMWNNLQGRRYASRHPDRGYLELFERAKAADDLILDLESVTDAHREEVERIFYHLRP